MYLFVSYFLLEGFHNHQCENCML